MQWNCSPNSWAHGALVPVRLHLAVNSDRSWTVIHISLVDIHTETIPFFLCFSSFLPLFPFYFPFLSLCLSQIVTVCLCRLSMIYDELHNRATSRRCLYKAPLGTDNASFHCSEKDRILCVALPFSRSGWRAVARGPFHNLGLVHRAVGWCAVKVWWLLLSKKMSQLITLSKHFHRQAHRKKSELRIGGLGKFAV